MNTIKTVQVEATGNLEVDALALALAAIATAPSVGAMVRIAEFALSKAKSLELSQAYEAWSIIANAHGGDWEKASPEWRAAATRWRDEYMNK